MINTDEILKVIEALPKLITYIYPGYLTIYCYLFFRGKTMRETKAVMVKSVAISYLYLEVLHAAGIEGALEQNAWLVVCSAVLPYLSFLLLKSRLVNRLFDRLGVQTQLYGNEMEALADFGRGAWLCVYLKDDSVVYEGSLGFQELEEGKRQYICLCGYFKYYLGEDGRPREPYVEDHAGENKETVMIFYDSIKRIEKRAVEQG